MKTQIEKKLKKAKIEHSFIKLPDDISLDIAEHIAFHDIEAKQAVPTLVFKTDHGLVAVQKRGDTKINNKKLKKVLKTKKLSKCSPEQLAELGTVPGAVPVVGLEIPYYMDAKVPEVAEIYGGSGDLAYAIKLKTEDAISLTKPQIVDVSDHIDQSRAKKPNNQTFENKRILSGITPSGNALHIGNYFGAVKPQIELQETHQTFYFVADLHALTTVKDKDQLEQNILGVVLDYLALGLDPEKAVFFRQSDVPAHSQLAVVLANYISYGQMQRMHAFKDKLQKDASVESINMGLFNYPILMAADILAYKPVGVPVGEDQRQHIELTRDIAENFNRLHDVDVLPLPEPMIPKATGKILGTDGQRKMSKSLGNYVGIFDEPKEIERQIMSAYTDPNRIKATDPGTIEGNTVFMYHDLINHNTQEVTELKQRYQAGTVGDVEVKQRLIEAHQRLFGPARQRRAELASDLDTVRQILASGAQKASAVAKATLKEVCEAIGMENRLSVNS